MTLPSSGTLTSTQIRTELALGVGVNLVVPDTLTRNLAGRLSGSVVWPNDFWGQTKTGYAVAQDQSNNIATVAGVATHAAMAFGATAWNRKIICMVWWACSTTAVVAALSSASIGGVVATVHTQRNDAGGSATSNYGCAIISATVPTGASGNVVLTFSNATVRRTYARTYRITGSNAGPTSVGSGFDEAAPAPSVANPIVSYGITKPATCLLMTAAIESSAGVMGGMNISGNSEEFETADATFDCRFIGAINKGLAAGATTITVSGTSTVTARIRSCSAAWSLL